MAKWIALWAGSIAAFVVFIIITQFMVPSDRYPNPETGIKMAYTKDLTLSGIHMFVDTTKNPSRIHFEAVADVENRQEHALLILVMPYSGIIQDNSGWMWKPFEKSTLFVKEFSCTAEEPCSFSDSNQFFDFDLDELIDQKQSYFHSVRLEFLDSSLLLDPTVSRLVGQFNQDRKPYEVGFDKLESAMATIDLDITSDSFQSTPDAPLVLRPNTIQLEWDIVSGILHQIDWQLPSERNLENKMLNYTALFGIGLGITNLAIYGMDQRKRGLLKEREKSG